MTIKGDRLFATGGGRPIRSGGATRRPLIFLMRPRFGALAYATCALFFIGFGARAEDSQPLSSRMMRMLGFGGSENASPDSSGSSAPSSAPASNAPAVPPAPRGAEGAPSQSRVLRMLGLTRGSDDDPYEKKARGLSECPDIVVDGVGAEMRAPAGADASSVAYQIAITRMARECALTGDDISVRVGLLGAAMLGPTGRPGAYFGNLHVALRRKSDNELFDAKTYRVGATIPANEARADFTLLVEQLTAPYISAKAGEDYEIVIGFAQGGGSSSGSGAETKRRKRGRL
jgi:hypothetical protein